jgi:hypothetical protein
MFKTLAIVAASIALTAGAASASNTFGLLTSVEQGDNYYDISTISTLGEGFVQIEQLCINSEPCGKADC